MIFYFSGTGNTEWAARKVSARLGETLVYIPDVISGECKWRLKAGEQLGFILPVHGWRPPELVRRFVKKLTIEGTPSYVFLIWTAGDTVGRATEILAADLAKRGLKLDSAFGLTMPESYVGLPFMDVDTPAREHEKTDKAAEDLSRYITEIQGERRGAAETIKGACPWLLSGPIGWVFVRWIISDRPFHVKADECIRCGRCADVCPVSDIDGGRGKQPRWRHNGRCMSCFACYHHCPKHAIEYGWRTRHKGQYFYGHDQKRQAEK